MHTHKARGAVCICKLAFACQNDGATTTEHIDIFLQLPLTGVHASKRN